MRADTLRRAHPAGSTRAWAASSPIRWRSPCWRFCWRRRRARPRISACCIPRRAGKQRRLSAAYPAHRRAADRAKHDRHRQRRGIRRFFPLILAGYRPPSEYPWRFYLPRVTAMQAGRVIATHVTVSAAFADESYLSVRQPVGLRAYEGIFMPARSIGKAEQALQPGCFAP